MRTLQGVGYYWALVLVLRLLTVKTKKEIYCIMDFIMFIKIIIKPDLQTFVLIARSIDVYLSPEFSRHAI